MTRDLTLWHGEACPSAEGTIRMMVHLPEAEDDFVVSSSAKKKPQALRILTHNIRYATTAPFKGEELWSVRRPRLCAELVFTSKNPRATFICLQEVLHSQLLDIHAALKESEDSWSYIGVGRDDGKHAGEYSPVFYQSAIWQLEGWKTFWLSETPTRPSKGWDAASTRIVTIGVFIHRVSGEKVVIMNTHLDDQGTESRAQSARLILKLVKEIEAPQSSNPTPLLLAGDLNSPPDDEAYQIIDRRSNTESGMMDIKQLISQDRRYGNDMTFTSFGYVDSEPSRIDFLFLNESKLLVPHTFAVLENKFDDGVYLSDHRAVVADLSLLSAAANFRT